MLGGARIVLFVVLQESRITASAAVAPTPHKTFSRLPCIHRVSLECHTNGEYCQKQEIVTTHFYGKNRSILPYSEISGVISAGLRTKGNSHAQLQRRFLRRKCVARYSVGDLPDSLWKTRLNCESDWKPAANAISLIRRLEFSRRSRAVSNRARAT